jgi:hypothetical protein
MNNSSNSNFVETVEHRRFAEFCDACGHYHYIGLCYGPSGVGKTLSARRYSRWDYLERIDWYAVPNEALESLIGIKAIFYITPVVNTPGRISSDIDLLRSQLHTLAIEPLRREAAQKLNQIDIRNAKYREEIFVTHNWLSKPAPKLRPTYAEVSMLDIPPTVGAGLFGSLCDAWQIPLAMLAQTARTRAKAANTSCCPQTINRPRQRIKITFRSNFKP